MRTIIFKFNTHNEVLAQIISRASSTSYIRYKSYWYIINKETFVHLTRLGLDL